MRRALLAAALLAAFCAAPSGPPVRRLSIATGGTGGVYYPYGGAIARLISMHVPGVEATAEVTAGTIDNLKLLDAGRADLGFALADSLAEAVKGTGPFAHRGPMPLGALAVLYANYTHLVTFADSGIRQLTDLRGRVVSTGAPGSGTELIALRLLEAAGIDPTRDLARQSLGVAQSADALKDGKIHAFFWSGGLPTGAVLDLATTAGRRLRLLATDQVLPALQARYGTHVYHRLVIPRTAYPHLDTDVAVVGVANVLVVHERFDAELAYRIVKALFEWKAELEAVHPEARALTLESAVSGSPAPFHPGAIRYYQERGVWRTPSS
jgi:TRAP transporter TAXI family solute receptor